MNRHVFTVAAIALLVGLGHSVRAEKYALLCGVNRYQYVRRDQWLEGCENDARLMEKLLTSRFGFKSANIRLLTNENATQARVLDALENWLVADKKPGDVLVFYWSGHGFQVKDENGDEEDGLDEVLAPYDVRMTSPLTGENYISDDKINEIVTGAAAGRTFVAIFDACHTGTGLRALEFGPRVKYLHYEPPEIRTRSLDGSLRDLFLERYYDKPRSQSRGDESLAGYDLPLKDGKPAIPGAESVVLVAAAQAGEKAAETEVKMEDGALEPHGALTFTLSKALRGEADRNRDGRITFSELRDYLRNPIQIQENVQHPDVEMCDAMRDIPLFQQRSVGQVEPPGPSERPPAPVPPPSSEPARPVGLQPLRVVVAPFSAVEDLKNLTDKAATEELRPRIEKLLSTLGPNVIRVVSKSETHDELVLYGARRGSGGVSYELGAFDATGCFALERQSKSYSSPDSLLQDLEDELNRAYMVTNLMRLRQPAGSPDRIELRIKRSGEGSRGIRPKAKGDLTFKLGEDVEFEVYASRPGYLSLINIQCDGWWEPIYPNVNLASLPDPKARDGWIEGGKTISLTSFCITRPVGIEWVKAFLTDLPIRLPAGRRPDGSYSRTRANAPLVIALYRSLGDAVSGDRKEGLQALANSNWAETSVRFVTSESD